MSTLRDLQQQFADALFAGAVLTFIPVIGSFMEPAILGGKDAILPTLARTRAM